MSGISTKKCKKASVNYFDVIGPKISTASRKVDQKTSRIDLLSQTVATGVYLSYTHSSTYLLTSDPIIDLSVHFGMSPFTFSKKKIYDIQWAFTKSFS